MSSARSLLAAVALLAAFPAAADAATLTASKACYKTGSSVRLLGTGFAPESPIRFAVNGRLIEQAVTSDPAGDVEVTYGPVETETERRLAFRATDEEGTTARRVTYVTEKEVVTARPSESDNVSRWRAVFRLFGWGRGRIYIHYVNPKGQFKKTVRLGRLRGPCGRLQTDRRRVMPFDRPQFGKWRLQFDKRRRYQRSTRPRRVIPVEVFRG